MTPLQPGAQNAARDELQDELLAADDDGVAGVVTAGVAGDDVELFAEDVDDLAFAFVAPLGAENDGRLLLVHEEWALRRMGSRVEERSAHALFYRSFAGPGVGQRLRGMERSRSVPCSLLGEQDDLAGVVVEVADDLVDGDEDGGVTPGTGGLRVDDFGEACGRQSRR